jgi:hypothetical protein
MQTVVETNAFLADAEKAGMSEGERSEVVTLVAIEPTRGVIPSGWGGARKFRFARPGRGKSGSYRIVTAYCGTATPVFLVTVFGKGEKANLTKGEANGIAKRVKTLCATYGK